MMKLFKRLGIVLAMCLMLTGLFACNGGDNSSSNDGGDSETVYNPFAPFWEDQTIENEPVVLVKNSETGEISGTLLFAPDEIICVKDYTLDKTYDPTEYTFKGNVIKATAASKMPFMTEAQLKGEDGENYGWAPYTGTELAFTEGVGLVMKQVNVTYKHSGSWTVRPTYQGEDLPNVRAKLLAKEEVNIFVYGDSISTGANSSGKLGIKPFLPKYDEGVRMQLEAKFGGTVNCFNGSFGGWRSADGLTNINAALPTAMGTKVPDLAIVAFGMNDGSWNVGADSYQDNMLRIISAIRDYAPDCDIIIISTILANPISPQNTAYTPTYLAKDIELANMVERCAHVDMMTFSKELYKNKKGVDILANNINHPNDFLVRSYVMNITGVIYED